MFYNQGAVVVFRKYVAVQNADVCGSAGKWQVQVEFNRNSGRRVERRMEENYSRYKIVYFFVWQIQER